MNTSQQSAVLDRVLNPMTEILTPTVAKAISEMRADPETQSRIDELAALATAGRLTEAQRREYREFLDALDLIGVLQAKARVVLARTPAA